MLEALPLQDIETFVRELALHHGVTPQRTELDTWAAKVTELCGDTVRLDDTNQLLVNLKRAGLINGTQLAHLSIAYLRELKARDGPIEQPENRPERIVAMTASGTQPASARLPYDEGDEAYSKRLLPSANPYPEADWRHDEWWLGWSAAEQIDDTRSYDWTTDSFKN